MIPPPDKNEGFPTRTKRMRNSLQSGRLFLNGFRNEVPQRIGRYRILEHIGAGSMGIVYKAFDPNLGRTVAIKTIRCDLLSPRFDYTRFITRFYHEARISGTLSHSNIVSLYDMGETADRIPFLAMEYAEGKTLGHLLAQDGPLRPERLLALLSQMADGIEYAHGKGVIHRDIKPSNIIVDRHGSVKITDFGIAKLMDVQFTESKGSQLGTPGYMSPEQVMGETLDERSDVFSLGVLAFEMLSGERPFPGPHVAAVLYRIVHRDPVRPSNLESLGFVPDEWQALFSKALAKEPSQRFASAGEFVRELTAVCRNCVDADAATLKPRAIPVDGQIDETLTLAPRTSSRPFRPRWVSALAAGLVMITGLVSLTLLRDALQVLPRESSQTETTPARRSPWLVPIPVGQPTEATGSISIRTDPPGATILLNGRERGATPLALDELAFGAHSIIIEKEAHQRVELAVLLSAEGPQTSLDIPLKPAGSSPAEETDPFPDTPLRDGVPTGSLPAQSPNPLTLEAVLRQEGRQLLLKNENHFDWRRVKLVLADTGITLNVERIEAGQTYTIIDPSASMPKTISIWCETPAGKGYYAATVSP